MFLKISLCVFAWDKMLCFGCGAWHHCQSKWTKISSGLWVCLFTAPYKPLNSVLFARFLLPFKSIFRFPIHRNFTKLFHFVFKCKVSRQLFISRNLGLKEITICPSLTVCSRQHGLPWNVCNIYKTIQNTEIWSVKCSFSQMAKTHPECNPLPL